jgi:hypothetical protein
MKRILSAGEQPIGLRRIRPPLQRVTFERLAPTCPPGGTPMRGTISVTDHGRLPWSSAG